MRTIYSCFLALLIGAAGCSSIDTDILGTNAFVNDPQFGTISQQFDEVQNTLGLQYVRVLFNWNDQIQPTPQSPQNFSFYDDIIANIPAGMKAEIILNGLPSWMSSSSNWINNNPRTTFVQLWVTPVLNRYKGKAQIEAWEIWNEPNMESNQDNTTLAIVDSPQNYVEMLTAAATVVRSTDPGKLVISAATTSINQGWPDAFKYNKGMKSAGAASVADIWGVHYYGKDYFRIFEPGGIKDFLNSLPIPIWFTESGQKGYNEQLQYAQETWPLLQNNIKKTQRIYQYQFTEDTPASSTFGLRNLTPNEEYSNLYNWLKDEHAD